uniref:purine-nucleoside phosphorylase n=1 Tax=Parascaris equorum TaxID=6256 RepID=A0A914S140_PAREQ
LVTLKEIPKVGIICGSGLGEIGDIIKESQILPYSKIPGFPSTNVAGHKGNLVFGYLGGKYVVCLQAGLSPLVGLNGDEWGPRFVSLHNQYDEELRYRLYETETLKIRSKKRIQDLYNCISRKAHRLGEGSAKKPREKCHITFVSEDIKS